MATQPVQELLKRKKICDIINPKCVQAPADISIREAVRLMRENRSGYLVLVENGEVAGLFTEKDLVDNVLGQKIDWGGPVREVMTQDPLVLTRDDTVGAAITLMGRHQFYHLPLVDKAHRVSGILSVRTLIRFLAEFYPTEVYNLPPDPGQVMKTQEGG